MVRRTVEYDNAGGMGRDYSMLRVRSFAESIELTAKPSERCEDIEDGIDVVLDREQMRHLRDLLNAELERPSEDEGEPMIREIE